MKAVINLSRALFSRNTNHRIANSLTKVKEADQVTENIHKRLKEIQKKLKNK
ncbi:hypothetical protein SNE25_00750 [Mucilaginibacter sabulilitoris]|uniref:Uncharacterized protein n=1 Tax=Mucilaginibacter sabulilitoris TaxID=1173583 RepID=A0ABZ0TLL3_9SPHI|nr:hypothetical protein [Mucilaginibacter sabulilitoris]WPU94052.1 hypothetical protein SNE25_00750 [Mucilaginibacter sabulilitoris]